MSVKPCLNYSLEIWDLAHVMISRNLAWRILILWAKTHFVTAYFVYLYLGVTYKITYLCLSFTEIYKQFCKFYFLYYHPVTLSSKDGDKCQLGLNSPRDQLMLFKISAMTPLTTLTMVPR